jgi:hypothetical protein
MTPPGALTCHEAERAISRRLDGRLARRERKPLRRHVRECPDCARFARSRDAQRSAWKVLAGVPLPPSLRSFSGAAGGKGPGLHAFGVTANALAVVAIGAGGVGVLYDGVGRPASTTMLPAPARQAPIQGKAGPRPTTSAHPRAVQARPARESVARRVGARPQRATPAVEHSATPKIVRARSGPIRARPRPKPAAPVRVATASPPPQPPAPAVPAEPPPPPTAPPAPPPPQPTTVPQLPQVPPLPVPLPLPLPPPPQLP